MYNTVVNIVINTTFITKVIVAVVRRERELAVPVVPALLMTSIEVTWLILTLDKLNYNVNLQLFRAGLLVDS